MLGKKQYVLTLLSSVLVFFCLFALAYGYISETSNPVTTPMVVDLVEELESFGTSQEAEARILPSTRITVRLQDDQAGVIEEAHLEAASLLGLTEETLMDRFKDYELETFDEEEVRLTKVVSGMATNEVVEVAVTLKNYVLGVDGDYVCIKEEGHTEPLTRIERKATDFSSRMYSLLLKESIHISEAQKDALIQDASLLPKIMQDYSGE